MKILGYIVLVGALILLVALNLSTLAARESLDIAERTLIEAQKTRYSAEIAVGLLLIFFAEARERLPRRTTEPSATKPVASE